MSQVIGLAYVKPTALRLVVRNKGYDARVYPGDTDWKAHLAGPNAHKNIAIVEDKGQFKKALNAELPLIVVCVNDLSWLIRREIPCLDGKQDGDTDIQLAVTPEQIYTEVRKAEVYATSSTDVWLTKSDPTGRCGGCQLMHAECIYEPTPTAKRPCGDGYQLDTSPKAHRRYNLSQLIHLALRSADESKLMEPPQEFWKATYQLAMGQMSRTEWINNHARLVKTAGTPKPRLQMILRWVKKMGPKLQTRKLHNPPSKLDLRLSEKLLKSK